MRELDLPFEQHPGYLQFHQHSYLQEKNIQKYHVKTSYYREYIQTFNINSILLLAIIKKNAVGKHYYVQYIEGPI